MSYEVLVSVINSNHTTLAQTAIKNKMLQSNINYRLKNLNSTLLIHIGYYLQSSSHYEWNSFIVNYAQELCQQDISSEVILEQLELLVEKIIVLVEQPQRNLLPIEKNKYIFHLQGLVTMSRISLLRINSSGYNKSLTKMPYIIKTQS